AYVIPTNMEVLAIPPANAAAHLATAQAGGKEVSEQALRSELRQHLNARLPLYMHPSRIVQREAFPLTIHGKVDRRALANAKLEIEQEEEKTPFVAPSNSVEEALAEIWSDVLRLKQVGIYDNFFELGGHSLLATQILSRVREFFQIKLPLRTIFEAPTIAALAEAVIQKTIEEADSDTIAQILAQPFQYPQADRENHRLPPPP
ncbi:MAG TPA: phosphopantetheine-binding protein, partial [Ktedonobacteraceae bacterium]|nr:phosphopantetheine-binding protein [Ktedonobacteraceae bacterium]